MSSEYIRDKLLHNYTVILLVDAILLNEINPPPTAAITSSAAVLNDNTNNTNSSNISSTSNTYAGHYIYLTETFTKPSHDELNTAAGIYFKYYDPARTCCLYDISDHNLDRCRLHPATDEDVLFIDLSSVGTVR